MPPRKSKRVYLLGKGNSKLGVMHTWSLPAGSTCPYRTELCYNNCYARKYRFKSPHVRMALARSLNAVRDLDQFVSRMSREIVSRKVQVLRIHVSGDFYSPEYLDAWVKIAQAAPLVRFFAFTRSWRGEEFAAGFKALAKLRNVRLWYSVDRETGIPGRSTIHKRVRLAYMALDDTDVPGRYVDLVFRTRRSTKLIRMAGSLVCPHENGTPAGHNMSCDRCRLCLDDLTVKDPRKFSLRLPLVSS